MENTTEKNFNTISPSAKWILLLKGHTTIPYARRTAELIEYPQPFTPDYTRRDLTFWGRTMHMESRYRSIDQLLEGLPVKNILELSSGYSFRGLEAAKQKGIYYIDTDLPEMIEAKQKMLDTLKKESSTIEGTLELQPLNALDENKFREIVSHFPPGPIAIVNEGLLMYLDIPEKEKLCRIIHSVLKERGGYWITADVYLKWKVQKLGLHMDDNTKEFFEQHHVEENKFETFAEAEAFFKRMGFKVDKEAKIKPTNLSSIKYVLKSMSIIQFFKFRRVGKIQATWRLRIAD
jgi:O-methyltransferase involved in polyketide biosynthesis